MKNNNNQDGFTLIEVMIAIFILTIGILGAAAMQVASIDGNSTATILPKLRPGVEINWKRLWLCPMMMPD